MACPEFEDIIPVKENTPIIGKGSQGTVYKVGDFVLKKIQLRSDKDKRLFTSESKTLHSLFAIKALQKYLPSLCWTYSTGETGYILQKYEPTITLQQLIQKTPKGTFSFEIGYALFKNLLLALVQLIKAGYLHRDIKPENILIRTQSEKEMKVPILIDFGLACSIEIDSPRNTSKLYCDEVIGGTTSYMIPNFLPPQIHKKQPMMTVTKKGTQKNVYVKTKLIPIFSSKLTDTYALALTLEEFMPIIDFSGHTKEEVEMRSFIEDQKKSVFLNTLRKRRNLMYKQTLGPIQVVEGEGKSQGGKRRTQKKRRAST